MGGGGKTICLPPGPQYFHWGGGGGRLWGQATWTSKGGMCTVADPGFAKKGVGGKIRARQRAPHTGGVQGPAAGPLPGAQGAEPPEALEFSANKGLQDGRQE